MLLMQTVGVTLVATMVGAVALSAATGRFGAGRRGLGAPRSTWTSTADAARTSTRGTTTGMGGTDDVAPCCSPPPC